MPIHFSLDRLYKVCYRFLDYSQSWGKEKSKNKWECEEHDICRLVSKQAPNLYVYEASRLFRNWVTCVQPYLHWHPLCPPACPSKSQNTFQSSYSYQRISNILSSVRPGQAADSKPWELPDLIQGDVWAVSTTKTGYNSGCPGIKVLSSRNTHSVMRNKPFVNLSDL